jgi:hypothetical protein
VADGDALTSSPMSSSWVWMPIFIPLAIGLSRHQEQGAAQEVLTCKESTKAVRVPGSADAEDAGMRVRRIAGANVTSRDRNQGTGCHA